MGLNGTWLPIVLGCAAALVLVVIVRGGSWGGRKPWMQALSRLGLTALFTTLALVGALSTTSRRSTRVGVTCSATRLRTRRVTTARPRRRPPWISRPLRERHPDGADDAARPARAAAAGSAPAEVRDPGPEERRRAPHRVAQGVRPAAGGVRPTLRDASPRHRRDARIAGQPRDVQQARSPLHASTGLSATAASPRPSSSCRNSTAPSTTTRSASTTRTACRPRRGSPPRCRRG